MIITISGANFSASNIGTLSTWTVSKSIGAGAEHSIPSYVDKNSAFNYTITLKDGYTFGTYSVTMGGQTITPTVTETSMTINIPSVTGAVRIEVKTINSSTGEEDKPVTPEQPGTGGGSGETIAEYILNKNIYSDGQLSDSSGKGRVAVTTYFPTNGKEPSVKSDITTTTIAKRYYDGDKKSVGTVSESSYCRIVLVINIEGVALTKDVYNGKTVTVNNIVYTLKPAGLSSDTPLKYRLNTNINAEGVTASESGRFCILAYIPTFGTQPIVQYSNPNYADSVGIAYRYYLEDKTTMSTNGASGSAYARLVFYNGTQATCTESNIENTNIVINGVTYTLSNK